MFACRNVFLRTVPCASIVAHGRGQLDAGHKNACLQKPAQDNIPNKNPATGELKITNAPDANLSFKEDSVEIKMHLSQSSFVLPSVMQWK